MSKPPVLLLALSLLLSAPAFAGQPLSTPALRAATNAQRSPSLAASPTDALAVWEDERALNPTLRFGADIYATRIGLDGVPSDDGGVPITADLRSEYSPRVVWTGSDYLVAHLVIGVFEQRADIRLTRVTLDGPVEEHLLGATSYDPAFSTTSANLSMATNGDVTLLVIEALFPTGNGPGAKPGIFGILVDRGLRLLRPAFRLTTDADPHAATVASNGRDFVVAWRQADDGSSLLRTAAVSAAGTVGPASTAATLSAFATNPPAIAWNGSRYLVVAADGMVHACLVNADGTPAGAAIDVHAGTEAAVAWNGGEFLIPFAVAGDVTDIYAVRLDAEGHSLDASPHAIAASPGGQTQPAVTALGGRFLVAWSDLDTIRSSIVSSAGEPSPQSLVARSLGTQEAPRGIFDGRNLGFAWLEDGHILFGRTALDGTPLDGPGLDLGAGTQQRLAFNGSEYLVAWTYVPPQGPPAGLAVRIAADGTLLDRTPLAIPASAKFIATNGQDFLVVPFMLEPVLVTADGTVRRQPHPTNNPDGEIVLSVDWTGTHYLVVYQDLFGPICGRVCNPMFETRSLLLDATGLASGQPNFVAPRDPTVQLSYQGAFGDGIEALVVSATPLRLIRLDERGVYLGQTTIPCTGVACFVPQVVWTGSDFAIVTGAGVQRVGADGTLHGEPLLYPPDASVFSVIPAGRSLAFSYVHRVPIEPAVPNGFVLRAFFDWVSVARRRAAG